MTGIQRSKLHSLCTLLNHFQVKVNTNGELSETSQLTTHHSNKAMAPNFQSWLSQGMIKAAAEPTLATSEEKIAE